VDLVDKVIAVQVAAEHLADEAGARLDALDVSGEVERFAPHGRMVTPTKAQGILARPMPTSLRRSPEAVRPPPRAAPDG
jgi:hypothetical protein